MHQKKLYNILFAILSLFIALRETYAEKSENQACVSVPDGNFIRSSRSCAHYYYCSNDLVTFEAQCPVNFLFSDVKQLCDHADVVNCNSCTTFGRPLFSDPENCGNFYRCVDGERKHYRCPDDMLFDQNSGACQNKELVNCLSLPESPLNDENPNDDPWHIPSVGPTRPPPSWGPVRPPIDSNGPSLILQDGIPIPPITIPSNSPGVSRPPNPTQPPQNPWGPPDAPSGGGLLPMYQD